MTHDLVLRGGRVLDPSTGVDEWTDVAFTDDRVAAVGDELDGAELHDVAGLLVVPGLVDLHTHVYLGGTWLGVDAMDVARASGTTTFVDAGSAGAGNIDGFVHHVIERSAVRIVPFLNISFAGLATFGTGMPECEDPRLLDEDAAVEAGRRLAHTIAGVKVRIGSFASGRAGVDPLRAAVRVATQLGVPVMSHLDDPPPDRDAVLELLRPGDVLTHCFRTSHGTATADAFAARARGVRFDVGHGNASFGFATARAMLEAGFPPDTISSDVHRECVAGPAHDVLVTMSKFLHLGMDLPDVVAAATSVPAAVLGRDDLGSFRPGAEGDAAVLEIVAGPSPFVDADRVSLVGDRRLELRGVVVGGRWLGHADE